MGIRRRLDQQLAKTWLCSFSGQQTNAIWLSMGKIAYADGPEYAFQRRIASESYGIPVDKGCFDAMTRTLQRDGSSTARRGRAGLQLDVAYGCRSSAWHQRSPSP